MVSKVAVVALVAILAVPIMMGYAMNLTEETYTEYKPDGDSVNVTQLIQNGETYSYAHGDIYKLNTTVGYGTTTKTYPLYVTSQTNPSSTLPATITTGFTNGIGGGPYSFSSYNTYGWTFNYTPSDSNHMTAYVRYGDSLTTFQIDRIKALMFDYSNNTLYYTEYVGNNADITNGGQIYDARDIRFSATGSFYAQYMQIYHRSGVDNKFVNIADGFQLFPSTTDWRILLPDESKSAILTINLDSINDANFGVSFEPMAGNDSESLATSKFYLSKTTTDGVVNWRVTPNDDPDAYVDLHYDPSRIDNTYQIYMEVEETSESGGVKYYDSHVEFRYVGGWPTLIGPANYYTSYSFDNTVTSTSLQDYHFDYIRFFNDQGGSLSVSPFFRVDDALFRAFKFYVIENETISPANFKTNPSTLIKVNDHGQSITFGGNTYVVDSDGNITLGTHKISVYNLVLDSVPVDGRYENRINGTTVSTSAQPSTISFNGKWEANVSISQQTSQSYTKTEWTPGQFGWDGIDHNFLIVGLLTSIGVFIALGIYIRKTGKGLWPLLIVCGGAAMLFFTML